MREVNFAAPSYAGIPQHEIQARHDWYNSLGNIARGVGSTVKDMADAYSTGMEARKAEEWRRRQWDNQMKQQEFSRQQTELQNRRYDEELRRRLAEQRRLEEDKQRRNAAAYKLRSEFMKRHSYGDIGKYGPGAEFAYGQMVYGTDWNDITAGGNMLNNIIAQQQMIEAQRQEQANARIAPNASNQMASELSLMNIDLNEPEASALRYSPDYYAAEDKLYNLNRRIQRTEDLINAGYGSDALYRQRAAMQRAAAALRRKMGTAFPSGAFPHKKEL